jgi:hypothetical protein
MRALVACALALVAAPAAAQPDLRRPQPAGALTVFPDARRAAVFYYLPGELAVAEAPGGRPDVTFLHVRYTGSGATGDRGKTFFRSVLTFRVRFAGPTADETREAKAALRRGAASPSLELRPLPVRRLDAALVFAPLADGSAEAAPAQAPTVVSEGHFEPSESPKAGAGADEGAWRERTYTVGMDPATAQMFSDALERGRVALSLGYALYASALAGAEPIDELKGSPELVAALRERAPVPQPLDPAHVTPEGVGGDRPQPQLVRAGAIAIAADARRWPDLVRRLDINESVPPGYAALDIYCYDFNNELRPDLYEKQVEVEALSVNGRTVRRLVAFQRDRADLYARTLSFSVAVRFDRPYRYRLVEVFPDGTSRAGVWQQGRSWTQILDVTSVKAGGDDTGRQR